MEPTADIDGVDDVLGARDVVVVDGPDAASYLHSQVSQDLQGMTDGERRWTFVLEPTGKVESLARVTKVSDERYELDTDAGWGPALLARIDRFKIRVRAETTLVPADGDVPVDDAARIEIGWPRLGVEIVAGETIPAGTGLTRVAVSFTKGCYPGQELVERMDSRAAEAPKSLRRLDVPVDTRPGDPIVDGTDEVGVVTSVADARALGWVKRTSGVGEVVQF
jgi:tRNA-modifying protein YgfZ